MAEDKIPVLTELYKPENDTEKKERPTIVKHGDIEVTPELIAKLVGLLKPRLEEEVTRSVLDNVRGDIKKDVLESLSLEIKKTKEDVQQGMQAFIDKTRADFKTELPAAFQKSVDLTKDDFSKELAVIERETIAHFNQTLAKTGQEVTKNAIEKIAESADEALSQFNLDVKKTQSEIGKSVRDSLTDEMVTFREAALIEHQSKLQESFDERLTILNDTGEQQLATNLETVETKLSEKQAALITLIEEVQRKSIEKINTDLANEAPIIFESIVQNHKTLFNEYLQNQSTEIGDLFTEKLNANLPEVEQILSQNIEKVLAVTIPALEESLRQKLRTDIQDLLQAVKFVLSS